MQVVQPGTESGKSLIFYAAPIVADELLLVATTCKQQNNCHFTSENAYGSCSQLLFRHGVQSEKQLQPRTQAHFKME